MLIPLRLDLQTLNNVCKALSNLKLLLNLLSVDPLSPSIIALDDLRELLNRIAQALLHDFKLVSDPDEDICHAIEY